MGIILLFSLLLLPGAVPKDPAPGLLRGRKASRNLECERTTVEGARRAHPGLVEPERPRGDFVDQGVLLCRERILKDGQRADRDDAVLSELEDSTRSIVASARTAAPATFDGRTWLVEAYYPDPQVAQKIDFATKQALVDGGLRVSDRTPALGAGDVDVLTRMAPAEAFPAACQRYAAAGDLRQDDVLLAVLVRDLRETSLHAGLCAEGTWRWVQ